MRKIGSTGVQRRAARLAAVQALYQMELAHKTISEAIIDITDRRSNVSTEDEELPTPTTVDERLFKDIVEGTTAAANKFDRIIDNVLKKERGVNRIEILLRLILRAGAYEILTRKDIDAPLSINEYVAISQAFFGGTEPSFVNGVLDQLAKEQYKTRNEKYGEG